MHTAVLMGKCVCIGVHFLGFQMYSFDFINFLTVHIPTNHNYSCCKSSLPLPYLFKGDYIAVLESSAVPAIRDLHTKKMSKITSSYPMME